MSELSNKLRFFAVHHGESLMEEAADEIEHLEGLLKQWAGNCTGMHGSQNRCGLLPADFTTDKGDKPCLGSPKCICTPPVITPTSVTVSSANPMCPIHGGLMQNVMGTRHET